ncbi:hydantoinase/oxoprolinase family protein [Bradyrhizobium sp. NP1]|uniref:hydantoinase/oxoprolinase family protein n=1 Tax=Bradyrhizobium sp. NP1 TaxID=3049772 RepID=UPI0025A5D5B4|nr:hydantoinase/oxoprolinase family protein [Bradyrhizobium sp. NP1]WJR77439.1 hydantoinase/oxoprolinase family protein [Bradyrhizobium sp. NP1]
MSYQISADVGGTFTDVVVQDEAGRVQTFKAPSTPANIVDGILGGISLAARTLGLGRSELLSRCQKFACGTTVATNAILERAYARTALLCTEGFRDTLLIREGGKQDTYNIAIDYPEAYIPRHLTYGVRERINSEGGIETPLDETQLAVVLDKVAQQDVEAIAVSLLWSIANPEHEVRIGELIQKKCPGIPYSLSHRTSPTIREYRRTSATAIDASLKPLIRRNVNELQQQLHGAGFKGIFSLVTSNGGQTSAAEIVNRPIQLCLSGPSAAPEAARQLLRQEGKGGNAIVVDMGGTSFDISIIDNWHIPMHRDGVIDSHMFGVPSVEVKTIGAGGGSIARVDAGGFIHVGPESAGATPGPACYGRGGVRPTVTDANLVRGFLDPDRFAGGTVVLHKERAEQAIREHVAEPLGILVPEAASLIGLAVEQNMVAAIEDFTIRQGIDPREYVMVVGGAAAGLHAVAIARELGIKNVLVPQVAGVLSAFGIMVSDIKSSFARSLLTSNIAFDFAGVADVLTQIESEGQAYLDRMNVAADRRELQFSVETRYRGQVWQLTLPLQGNRIPNAASLADTVEAFHKLHEKRFFVRSQNDPVEFVEWSVDAIGRLPKRAIERKNDVIPQPQNETIKLRKAYAPELGGEVDFRVYGVDHLLPGVQVEGPAILDQALTSIVLYPGNKATVTESGAVSIVLPP